MKIHAVSIVLLLTASALAGCAGSSDSDSDLESELAGTFWIIIPELDFTEGYLEFYCSNDGEDYAEYMGGILCPEGPGNVPTCPDGQSCVCMDVDGSCTDGDDDWGYQTDLTSYYHEMMSIREFREDGVIEDFALVGEDGCPIGTIPHADDESLCAIDTDMEFIGDLGNMTWDIDDNGHLVISSYMTMGGDEFGMGMDEMTCNLMADFILDSEGMTHYSTEYGFNWLDEEMVCEIFSEMKMKVILEDGNIFYHLVHRVMEGQMMEMSCGAGIEWTGQAELSESEVSTFGELLSKCPAVIPYDAVVWECELQVRLDSLPDLSEQSFNDSISERPGYPEWCGGIVPDNLTLDGSEPNLPPGEEMYGLHYGYGVYARNETHWMDSWFEQEDCNGEGGYWDEKYDMCAIPTGCPAEVDSQLIYEECLPGQWARYHWSGDYLYIGMPSDRWM